MELMPTLQAKRGPLDLEVDQGAPVVVLEGELGAGAGIAGVLNLPMDHKATGSRHHGGAQNGSRERVAVDIGELPI